MHIKKIDFAWNAEYSIYASELFLKTVGDEYGWLGGFDDADDLKCVLPYTIIIKAKVKMVRFRIETIILKNRLSLEEEQDFLNKVILYFRSIEIDIIIPPATNTIFKTFPKGAIVAPYGTLLINLQKSENELWANLHSKHRNVIRNAEKKGVKINTGLDYKEIAHQLISLTFKRSSMPFMSYDEFDRLVSGLGQYIKIYVAEYQDKIVGCAVIPYSNYCAYYIYGGGIEKPLTGTMNLIQWEAIKYFRNLGVKYYDFCGVRINPKKGSKAAGLMMFKERFGPSLIKGYMWKYHINPIKSALYSLAIRIARGGDIIDSEKHKLNRE